MPKFICGTGDRTEWLAHRRRGIGGSDGAAILGIHPYRSRMDVYLEKLGIEANEDDAEREERMAWGSWMEPHVRGFYEKRTGRTVRDHGILYQDENRPWLRVTTDGIIDGDDRGIGILEAKATSSYAFRKHWSDGPPMWVKVQLYHGCLVMGARWGTVIVVTDGPPKWWDVEMDMDFVERVYLPELEAFWRCVETETPPEPDGSEACKKALSALYRGEGWEDLEEEGILNLGGEWLRFDEERQRLMDEQKGTKQKIERMNQKIKAEMGKHGVAVLPDGTQYTWRKLHRNEYISKACDYDRLDRKAGKGD